MGLGQRESSPQIKGEGEGGIWPSQKYSANDFQSKTWYLYITVFSKQMSGFLTNWDAKREELASGTEQFTNATLSHSFHKP